MCAGNRQQWQLGCASVQSNYTQWLNADELGNSAGVRVMRGMPFACMLRAGNHPLPISATAKSGWMIADYGLPILEMATLSHNATILSWGEECGQCGVQPHSNWSISAISAGKCLAQHMCAAGDGVGAPGTNVRGTGAKPCAARVHCKCIAGLLWCRCSGRVSEASAPMSGPGEACPNKEIDGGAYFI